MAGLILLLMALGAMTAAALFAAVLYRVVVCPLARLARLLLAAVARSYRLIAGGTP